MTRKEAQRIELLVDALFSKALGEPCTCSLSLTNRLRISLRDNNYINLNIDGSGVNWFKYEGFYDELIDCIEKATKCLKENSDLIDKLIWSYEHISELEEENPLV